MCQPVRAALKEQEQEELTNIGSGSVVVTL